MGRVDNCLGLTPSPRQLGLSTRRLVRLKWKLFNIPKYCDYLKRNRFKSISLLLDLYLTCIHPMSLYWWHKKIIWKQFHRFSWSSLYSSSSSYAAKQYRLFVMSCPVNYAYFSSSSFQSPLTFSVTLKPPNSQSLECRP